MKLLALVDPTAPDSFLDLRLGPDRTTTSLVITPAFPALRTYTILAGTIPDPATFTPLTSPTVSDNGNERTVTHPTTGDTRTFHQLQITKP